jgi:hypothetical protein
VFNDFSIEIRIDVASTTKGHNFCLTQFGHYQFRQLVGSVVTFLKPQAAPDDVGGVLDGRRVCSRRTHDLDGIAE